MKKNQTKALVLFALGLIFTFCSLESCAPRKATVDNGKSQQERYVVVLSLDGFRSDYTKLAYTPTLDSLARVGLSAELQPCFPSLTFPNHYSMATGLYPDHHGIVSNRFWDAELGAFSIGNRRSVEEAGFWLGEPIWNTAERQGLSTAIFYWVGSEAPVNGRQPSRWKKFSKALPYRSRVDSVISWLSLPEAERPRLVMFYMEEPDESGHKYTPEGVELKAKVEQMDSVVGYFCQQMRQLEIADQIDFLLVSDHGMATYTPEGSVDLTKYLPRDSFVFVEDGAFVQLQPKPGYKEQAYQILQQVPRCKVYYKEDMPARLHAGTSKRMADIVLLPELGSYFYFRKDATLKRGGAHGYDNEALEMQALFRATGPSFEAGKRLRRIPNITLYPLICELLGIEPAPNDADAQLAKSLIAPKK